ncbi:MAG: SRPBCC family protein [Amaricoccus sp.]|uniref:SRPBCC family protein n=1 Tax=Amaricoccus sp. TaxID=1872485 RepID=UPI0039E255B8
MAGWRRGAVGLVLVAALAGSGGVANAHGPSRQKASEEATLGASVADVWAVVGNFADMGWYPGVTKTEAAADGKTRTVSFGEVTVPEELGKFDAEKHTIAFRRTHDDVKLIPVTNFANTIVLSDEGGKAHVKWTAAFYRGDPNGNPPPEMNDEAALAAAKAFIDTGLGALETRFGAGG